MIPENVNESSQKMMASSSLPAQDGNGETRAPLHGVASINKSLKDLSINREPQLLSSVVGGCSSPSYHVAGVQNSAQEQPQQQQLSKQRNNASTLATNGYDGGVGSGNMVHGGSGGDEPKLLNNFPDSLLNFTTNYNPQNYHSDLPLDKYRRQRKASTRFSPYPPMASNFAGCTNGPREVNRDWLVCESIPSLGFYGMSSGNRSLFGHTGKKGRIYKLKKQQWCDTYRRYNKCPYC